MGRGGVDCDELTKGADLVDRQGGREKGIEAAPTRKKINEKQIFQEFSNYTHKLRLNLMFGLGTWVK